MLEKASWVYKQNLGGVSFFTVRDDDVNNTCGCGSFPLLRAVNQAFGRVTSLGPATNHCSVKNATTKSDKI